MSTTIEKREVRITRDDSRLRFSSIRVTNRCTRSRWASGTSEIAKSRSALTFRTDFHPGPDRCLTAALQLRDVRSTCNAHPHLATGTRTHKSCKGDLGCLQGSEHDVTKAGNFGPNNAVTVHSKATGKGMVNTTVTDWTGKDTTNFP